MTTNLKCRAQLSQSCSHEKPESTVDDEYRMKEDGTWDGQTVVCYGCYVLLMPFTPSGQGLNEELDKAITHVRAQLDYLRTVEDLSEPLRDVQKAVEGSIAGSSLHASALAAVRLIELEKKRRESVAT